MRRSHPFATRRWDATAYASQGHIVVTPRARTRRSDVDEQLEAKGLKRHVTRVVPSFTLALPLVACSDLLTTIPERCSRELSRSTLVVRDVPFKLRPLSMKIVVHPAHAHDARVHFMKALLREALGGRKDRA